MSSDNFWFVEGNKVYMGDASDYGYFMEKASEKAERKYRKRVIKRGAYHEAATAEAAQRWAFNEYSEYGVYWIDGE